MPANKNAVIRYKILDDLLSDRHHYYSMEELTEKVNERLEDYGYLPVVSRTLEKDLVFLQERPFCIPLERKRRDGKSYIKYSESNFSIFSHQLTKEEQSMLYEVLNTIGQFNGLPNFKWLEGLREEMGLKKQKQIFAFSNNPLLKNSNILASLYDVVANECVIQINYKRFTEAQEETFFLHPYLLKQYNNRWYLVGWQPEKDKIFTLAIDRIINFLHCPLKKFKPYPGDINTHFENTIGVTVFDDAEPKAILFWTDDNTVPYITTKPLHKSQTMVDIGESEVRGKFNLPSGGQIFKITCTLNYELEQTLSQNFGQVLVISPTELRDSIAMRIEEMNKKYQLLRKNQI